jgi:hypothetical protein
MRDSRGRVRGLERLGQSGTEDATLSVTRFGAGGFNVGPGLLLAQDAMEEHRVEIRKNDPGAEETRGHDGGAEATEQRALHKINDNTTSFRD